MVQRPNMTSSATMAQPDTVALFVSDVHLQTSLPRTTKAFFDFLEQDARHAQQLYLLGDLFEYWAGDDDIADPYNNQVVDAIKQVSQAGVSVYWIGGNRDFMVAEQFAERTGATPLQEPFVTTISGLRVALVHGDAQCTDDKPYMAFREKVRQPIWQREFLALPLTQRKAIISDLRTGSREAQRTKSYDIMDVNADAIGSLFDATGADVIIHGHTHRPARHDYTTKNGLLRVRYVLPDWDCDSDHPRGGWLGIDTSGTITRYSMNGQA
jgi:UDP-2,3-diacylglucosamine hydrolase